MSARAKWKAYWRRLRIARREYGKAHRDMMIFGTGYVRVDDAGFINHILPESVVIDCRTEVGGQ